MRIGDRVMFGRPNGEQSLGEVVKINSKNVKVKLLENRGAGRGSAPGSIWNVGKTLCRPVDASAQSTPATPPASPLTPPGSVLERALSKLTSDERSAVALFYRSSSWAAVRASTRW
jgi:hypothetical protein